MNKILGSLLFILNFLWAGSISATVDSTEVLKGDSVMLSLAVTGKNIDQIPEIQEINGYKVFNMSRRSSTNFVHVNGVSSMEKTQMMTLEFRPDENMSIPSFSVKVDGRVESTKAINISVLKSATGTKRATKDFSLDIEIEKSRFYLGESIVLNLYFKQRRGLDVLQIEYTPPVFKDFFAKQIGDGTTYRKGNFSVQELNYLLIAKKVGNLTLEPARAKIAQRSRQRQMGGWYVDVPQWTKISSSALNVEVITPTQQHDIVGQYRLLDKVDVQKVKSNKPVTLKIELVGTGSLDDYDGIDFDIPSVTMYSSNAKISSELKGKKLQSRYAKSFVFIAEHNFTIPSKEIRVYDYQTAEVKVLKTKAYFIEVEGSKSVLSTLMVHSKTPVVSHAKTLTPNKTVAWDANLPSILALLLAFIIGIIFTLAMVYLSVYGLPEFKFKKINSNYEKAFGVLYPKIGESKEVEAMVRKLYAKNHGDSSIEIDKEYLDMLVQKFSEKEA